MTRYLYYKYKLENLKTRFLTWPIFRITDRKSVQCLKRNSYFKNKYYGQRCFIIGNGPSLANVDLSILRDEYTFSVNQASRSPQYKELRTNFHIWIDSVFFKIDPEKEEEAEVLRVMKSMKTGDYMPTVFFPIDRYSFAGKYGLDSIFDIYYLKGDYRFLPDMRDIDYSKIGPKFSTVVQYCIGMAIFMGFRDIYLVGCDNTGIINDINSFMKVDSSEYSYEVSSNEKNRRENSVKKKGLYPYVLSYLNVLFGYESLFKYCERRGINLMNCTKYSAIEMIPHADLSDVLGGHNHSVEENCCGDF